MAEAQARIVALEAERDACRARLSATETTEAEAAKTAARLQAENAQLHGQHEQQRLLFDKCLDDIANHVVQALISQKVETDHFLFRYR